jgi:methionine-rich copper-binding protein CopC
MRLKPIKMKPNRFYSFIKVLPVLAMLSFVALTSCDKDKDPGVRPTVISTNPVSNATGIALNNKVAAVFSVGMNASTSSKLTLKQGATTVAGASEYTGVTVSFTPTAALAANTVYTATISKTAENESGTSLLKDYTWSFTTGAAPDITRPTVTLSNPANNAVNVSVKQAVVITFSEAMDQSGFNALTYTLKQGSTVIAGAITSTSTTATFTPSVDLQANTIYTALITVGAKDIAGNTLLVDHVLTFTTAVAPDIALPMVTATQPLNSAMTVARNKKVSVTFSEDMNAETIKASSFTLKQGSNSIAGTIVYAAKTATFTPTARLAAGLTYTATITTEAKDIAGNALASNTVWSFTTSNNTSSLALVNLGEAGNYVLLAKTAIINSGTSAVTGDLGLSPAATSYITGFALTDFTGFATSSQITGKVFAADMASPTPVNLTTSVENMITAYNDAAGRPSPDFLELGTGDIGGETLTPGLYKWTTTVSMPSDVVISGGSNDIWIFQISGDLSMSSAVNITLTGGAQAKNIFWQIAGEATIGTTAHFEGIILSMTGVTFQTGASLHGRALAQTAVVLDGNAITKPN